jgi:hypothetical protein
MPNQSVRRVGDQKSPMESSGSETSRIVGVETSVYHAPKAITMSRWVAVRAWLHASSLAYHASDGSHVHFDGLIQSGTVTNSHAESRRITNDEASLNTQTPHLCVSASLRETESLATRLPKQLSGELSVEQFHDFRRGEEFAEEVLCEHPFGVCFLVEIFLFSQCAPRLRLNTFAESSPSREIPFFLEKCRERNSMRFPGRS